MSARQSSIDRLPPDIREKLQELLRDPRVTQLEATFAINEILEEEGHRERVSKSAVNRYDMEMRKVGEKLRQSREVAEMWIGKLGAAPQGKLGNLVGEIVRTLSFEAGLKMQEFDVTLEEMPAWLKMLKDLALTNQRLEAGATLNVKRDAEIRKQALAEAAATIEKSATQAGVSQDTIQRIRRDVLRMAA